MHHIEKDEVKKKKKVKKIVPAKIKDRVKVKTPV
jgi:hypothetical protein